MMRLLPVLLASAILAYLPSIAHAELYDDLGGKAGLDTIVEYAIQRWLADPRVGPTFAETNMIRFRRLLTEQLCQLSGGPCRYTGKDMAAAHKALGLAQLQFNALAEDLFAAMGGCWRVVSYAKPDHGSAGPHAA